MKFPVCLSCLLSELPVRLACMSMSACLSLPTSVLYFCLSLLSICLCLSVFLCLSCLTVCQCLYVFVCMCVSVFLCLFVLFGYCSLPHRCSVYKHCRHVQLESEWNLARLHLFLPLRHQHVTELLIEGARVG